MRRLRVALMSSGLRALQWRHAVDDAFLALDVFLSAFHVHPDRPWPPSAAGSLSIRLDRPPICFICWIWAKKSFRSKPAPLLTLAAELLRRLHVHTEQ